MTDTNRHPVARPVALGVNVDHVATLRQARRTRYPDPAHAAFVAQDAGADVITFHLREDRRHIQRRDVDMIIAAAACRTNMEIAMTAEMMDIAEQAGPDDCCIVPEKRRELTTEGGLDVVAQTAAVKAAVARLGAAGIRVSLFIDPDERQIDAAAECAAPVVELHTGQYAQAHANKDRAGRERELRRLADAARHAAKRGLVVNAGHGLDYPNVAAVAAIDEIAELNIGHAIVCRAVFAGFESAVREMVGLLREARR